MPETELASEETLADAPAVLPDGWRGVIAGLDIPTGDGRLLATPESGVRTREYPLTLTLQHVGDGMDQPVGSVDRVWVEGGMLMGEGRFDLASQEGQDTARRLADGIVNTVSIHPDQLTATYGMLKADGTIVDYSEIQSEDEYSQLREDGAQEIVVFSDWRLAGLAVVSIPAYTEARIEPVYDYEVSAPTKADAIVAAVGGQVFTREFFQDPKFDRPTPLHVDEDGRVSGHVALWNSCYQYADGANAYAACKKPPRSASHYAAFLLHRANLGGGESIPCGVITYGKGHVSRGGLKASQAHYAEVGTQGAKVATGEDRFGIWVSGEVLDNVREFAHDIFSAPPSAHWEPDADAAGNLEMLAVHVVNTPGYKVPALVASFGNGEDLDGLTVTGWTVPEFVDGNRGGLDDLADAIIDRMEARAAAKELSTAQAMQKVHTASVVARLDADATKARRAELMARLA